MTTVTGRYTQLEPSHPITGSVRNNRPDEDAKARLRCAEAALQQPSHEEQLADLRVLLGALGLDEEEDQLYWAASCDEHNEEAESGDVALCRRVRWLIDLNARVAS